MPLFYQQNINLHTKLAVWKIEECEDFFSAKVPIKRDITHPHKRLQHLGGRFLLPYLFEDFPNGEIEIADTRKPFLPGEQYHFSISHCSVYAAAIVSSNERVGVDVEVITPRVEKIKSKFLHIDELRFVDAYPPEKQVELLTILWSAKEAMYKWYGRGEVDFSEAMRLVPFQLKESGQIEGLFIKPDLEHKLTLSYKVVDGLSIVWVHSHF